MTEPYMVFAGDYVSSGQGGMLDFKCRCRTLSQAKAYLEDIMAVFGSYDWAHIYNIKTGEYHRYGNAEGKHQWVREETLCSG